MDVRQTGTPPFTSFLWKLHLKQTWKNPDDISLMELVVKVSVPLRPSKSWGMVLILYNQVLLKVWPLRSLELFIPITERWHDLNKQLRSDRQTDRQNTTHSQCCFIAHRWLQVTFTIKLLNLIHHVFLIYHHIWCHQPAFFFKLLTIILIQLKLPRSKRTIFIFITRKRIQSCMTTLFFLLDFMSCSYNPGSIRFFKDFSWQ